MLKNRLFFIIILSVGLFPTDIFLYAQNSDSKISKAYELLACNQLDSLDVYIKPLFKDTLVGNKTMKANLFLLFGSYYDKKNKEEIGLNYFNKAEDLLVEVNNKEKLAELYYKKFSLLSSRKSINTKIESLVYLNKYLDYAKKNTDVEKLKDAYMGFAIINFNAENYKKSLAYYDKAIEACLQIKDTFSLARIYSNKGLLIANYYKKNDSARIFYAKALKLFRQLKKNELTFYTTFNIGSSYWKEGKFKEALHYYQKADAMSIVKYKLNTKKILYKKMAFSYDKTKDYKKAFSYLKKYNQYKDSIDTKTQNIAISNIQAQYESEKSEKKIIQLKADKDKQKSFLTTTIAAFLFTSILGVLAFINVKRKKDIAEKNRLIEHQKVVSLIREQELNTLDAIVEGQEKERKRIAEDLHDNLGSKLAVLKLHFDGFTENALIANNSKQVEEFASTAALLDETYQVVRSMSHAESDRVIIQSLIHSLRVLAASISNTNKISIEITDFGFEESSLSQKTEMFVLRIIQELITNMIKYANATKASIDLTLYDNELNIIFSDDGVGFDKDTLLNNGLGMGLKSIKDRVNKLNGTFEIDTGLNNGATFIIELPIKQNKIK